MPVPLHPRRERERSYNQSALLAQDLSKSSDIPVQLGVLRRTRNAASQVSIRGREEHRRNIDGALQCGSPVRGVACASDRRHRDHWQHDVGLRRRVEGRRGQLDLGAGSGEAAL